MSLIQFLQASEGKKNVQGLKARMAGKVHRNAVLTTERLYYVEFFLMVLEKGQYQI